MKRWNLPFECLLSEWAPNTQEGSINTIKMYKTMTHIHGKKMFLKYKYEMIIKS